MNTQPHNSMVPAYVQGRFGEHHGMTMAEAEVVISGTYDYDNWQDVLDQSSARYILGQDAMALDLAQHAIALFPCTPAYINLAVILGSCGRFLDALYAAQDAHRLDPEDRTAATLYAESLLRQGKWPAAWPLFHNYYDAKRVTLFSHAIKEWTGQPLKGKRLLLIEGGGFGDNFFFLRWASELKRQGAHITYLCPESMCSLMEQQNYIDRVIPTNKGECGDLRVDEYDYFTPLLALGHKFNRTVENTKWDGPYITSGPGKTWFNKPMRIGVCWQAGEAGLPRPFRSLGGLEKGALNSAILAHKMEIVGLVPGENREIHDWADTARLARSCDLVITVDTAVAHLAGAMGVPTWVILPGFSAWYYLLGPNALYPTHRLFRNHVRGLDIATTACCEALRQWKR